MFELVNIISDNNNNNNNNKKEQKLKILTRFITSLIYDGLTYLNSTVGDNIFVNWTLLNIIELPAQIMCHFTLSKYGRRITTCLSLIACGITLLLTNITSLGAWICSLFKQFYLFTLFFICFCEFRNISKYIFDEVGILFSCKICSYSSIQRNHYPRTGNISNPFEVLLVAFPITSNNLLN